MSRSHHKGGEPTQRMLRVAELIRHAMAQVLTRGVLNEPALVGRVVTIPSVKMSPDLKLATVFVMPLGGEDRQLVVEALERHKKFLRGEIAQKINLRYAPDVRFKIDESFENAARIDALLHSPKVAQDLALGEEENSGETDEAAS